jgi:hypothetical protein
MDGRPGEFARIPSVNAALDVARQDIVYAFEAHLRETAVGHRTVPCHSSGAFVVER